MKNVHKRLQGAEWHNMKDSLTLVKLQHSKNKKHVKGFYKDSEGKIYSHWLNDEEIQREVFNKYTVNQIRKAFGLRPMEEVLVNESKI